MSTLRLARRARVKVTPIRFGAIAATTLVLCMGASAGDPAFASRSANVSHAPNYTPRFEPGACAAGVPNDPRVDCGVLIVPENRDLPQRAQVHLPVAIVRSQAAARAPDPIVQLVGGPGDPAFPILSYVLAADLGGPRDVIAISQRGAAASTPNLDCPELEDATWAQFATADPAAVEQRRYDDAVRGCRARLRTSGADLNSYNTVTNAIDISDLRIALGLREWNLWGLSYGTVLAQEIMRHHPDGLRSVVLDSMSTLNEGRGGTAAVHQAMASVQHLIDGCAAAPACATSHPTLARDLNDVVVALDNHPYQSVVTDPNTGMPRPIAITGRDIISGVAILSSNPSLIPLFPQLVRQLKAGQYGTIDVLASMLITPGFGGSDGMALSVMCSDRGRIDVRSGLRRLVAAHPEYEAVPSGANSACPAWRVRPVPRSFNEPVTSAIRTLVLAGEWDPSTPAKSARDAATHLKRSSFVELPGLGHVVVRPTNPCAQSLLQGFFANPAQRPDTTCVNQLPEPAWN